MYIDVDRTYSSIQIIPVFFTTKGQMKPNADWRAVDSPKKQTNDFVFSFFFVFRVRRHTTV